MSNINRTMRYGGSMKQVIGKALGLEIVPADDNSMLAAIYPQLYCPRCGSYEIGLRKFDDDQAIWGCRECAALFNLDFPGQRRF